MAPDGILGETVASAVLAAMICLAPPAVRTGLGEGPAEATGSSKAAGRDPLADAVGVAPFDAAGGALFEAAAEGLDASLRLGIAATPYQV